MNGKTIQEFGSITAVDNDDLLVGVDVSDTTDSAGGTNKQFTKSNLLKEYAPLNLLKEYASLTGTETLTNKTLSTGSTIDTNVTVTAVLEKTYPVGSIYINATDSTNPATLFGFGIWTAFGAGRVMVGFDSEDTDFDTAEKTGGAKTHTLSTAELPSHSHSVSITSGTPSNNTSGGSSRSNTGNNHRDHTHQPPSDQWLYGYISSGGTQNEWGSSSRIGNAGATGQDQTHYHSMTHTHSLRSHTHSVSGNTGNAGSGSAHNNMPPFITVFMWKRTA